MLSRWALPAKAMRWLDLPSGHRCLDFESQHSSLFRPYFFDGPSIFCSACGEMLMTLEIDECLHEGVSVQSKQLGAARNRKALETEVVG